MFHTNRYNSCSIFSFRFSVMAFVNWPHKEIESASRTQPRGHCGTHSANTSFFLLSLQYIHTYSIFYGYIEKAELGGSGHKIEISCNWSLSFCFFGFWVLLRLLCPSPFTALLPLVRLQLSFPVWFARGQTIWAALKFHTLIYSFSEQSQSKQSRASFVLWTQIHLFSGLPRV